jgi:hypothetical protein
MLAKIPSICNSNVYMLGRTFRFPKKNEAEHRKLKGIESNCRHICGKVIEVNLRNEAAE